MTWKGDYFRLGQPFLGDGSKVCGLLGGLFRPPAVASVTLGVQAWTWSRLDTHPVVKGWACAWVSGRPDTEINRPPGNLCLQNLPQGWQGLGLSWLSLSASSIIVLSFGSSFFFSIFFSPFRIVISHRAQGFGLKCLGKGMPLLSN